MNDQSNNDQFHAESFLQGHNLEYIEQLQARYAVDPASVDDSWRTYFAALGVVAADAKAEADGPSWGRKDWPLEPADDLTAALDGQWPAEPEKAADKIRAKAAEKGASISDAEVKQAVLDSIRALMLIRAYRIRGHLSANLDPLHIEPPKLHPELEPAMYGFTEADLDRPIFLDNVLGMEHASMREIVEIVKRTYCGTFALQYMHISNAAEAAG